MFFIAQHLNKILKGDFVKFPGIFRFWPDFLPNIY
jgi:hypothetical protein